MARRTTPLNSPRNLDAHYSPPSVMGVPYFRMSDTNSGSSSSGSRRVRFGFEDRCPGRPGFVPVMFQRRSSPRDRLSHLARSRYKYTRCDSFNGVISGAVKTVERNSANSSAALRWPAWVDFGCRARDLFVGH